MYSVSIHSFVQVYPELDYTSSTVLLEATVKSPINILFPDSGSSEEVEDIFGEEGKEWEWEWEGESADLQSDDADLVPAGPRKKRGNSLSSGQSRTASQAYSSSHPQSQPVDNPDKRSRQTKVTGKPMAASQVYSSHPRPLVTREKGPPPVDNSERQVDMDSPDVSCDASLLVQEKLHSLISNYVEAELPPHAQKDMRARRTATQDVRGRAPTRDMGERGVGPSHSRQQSASSRVMVKPRLRHRSGE